MSELRQQMIDAVLVHGFSPRTHKLPGGDFQAHRHCRRIRYGIGPILAVFDTISREVGGRVLRQSAS